MIKCCACNIILHILFPFAYYIQGAQGSIAAFFEINRAEKMTVNGTPESSWLYSKLNSQAKFDFSRYYPMHFLLAQISQGMSVCELSVILPKGSGIIVSHKCALHSTGAVTSLHCLGS